MGSLGAWVLTLLMPLMLMFLALCEIALLVSVLGIAFVIKQLVDFITGSKTNPYNSTTYPSEVEFRCI